MSQQCEMVIQPTTPERRNYQCLLDNNLTSIQKYNSEKSSRKHKKGNARKHHKTHTVVDIDIDFPESSSSMVISMTDDVNSHLPAVDKSVLASKKKDKQKNRRRSSGKSSNSGVIVKSTSQEPTITHRQRKNNASQPIRSSFMLSDFSEDLLATDLLPTKRVVFPERGLTPDALLNLTSPYIVCDRVETIPENKTFLPSQSGRKHDPLIDCEEVISTLNDSGYSTEGWKSRKDVHSPERDKTSHVLLLDCNNEIRSNEYKNTKEIKNITKYKSHSSVDLTINTVSNGIKSVKSSLTPRLSHSCTDLIISLEYSPTLDITASRNLSLLDGCKSQESKNIKGKFVTGEQQVYAVFDYRKVVSNGIEGLDDDPRNRSSLNKHINEDSNKKLASKNTNSDDIKTGSANKLNRKRFETPKEKPCLEINRSCIDPKAKDNQITHIKKNTGDNNPIKNNNLSILKDQYQDSTFPRKSVIYRALGENGTPFRIESDMSRFFSNDNQVTRREADDDEGFKTANSIFSSKLTCRGLLSDEDARKSFHSIKSSQNPDQESAMSGFSFDSREERPRRQCPRRRRCPGRNQPCRKSKCESSDVQTTTSAPNPFALTHSTLLGPILDDPIVELGLSSNNMSCPGRAKSVKKSQVGCRCCCTPEKDGNPIVSPRLEGCTCEPDRKCQVLRRKNQECICGLDKKDKTKCICGSNKKEGKDCNKPGKPCQHCAYGTYLATMRDLLGPCLDESSLSYLGSFAGKDKCRKELQNQLKIPIAGLDINNCPPCRGSGSQLDLASWLRQEYLELEQDVERAKKEGDPVCGSLSKDALGTRTRMLKNVADLLETKKQLEKLGCMDSIGERRATENNDFTPCRGPRQRGKSTGTIYTSTGSQKHLTSEEKRKDYDIRRETTTVPEESDQVRHISTFEERKTNYPFSTMPSLKEVINSMDGNLLEKEICSEELDRRSNDSRNIENSFPEPSIFQQSQNPRRRSSDTYAQMHRSETYLAHNQRQLHSSQNARSQRNVYNAFISESGLDPDGLLQSISGFNVESGRRKSYGNTRKGHSPSRKTDDRNYNHCPCYSTESSSAEDSDDCDCLYTPRDTCSDECLAVCADDSCRNDCTGECNPYKRYDEVVSQGPTIEEEIGADQLHQDELQAEPPQLSDKNTGVTESFLGLFRPITIDKATSTTRLIVNDDKPVQTIPQGKDASTTYEEIKKISELLPVCSPNCIKYASASGCSTGCIKYTSSRGQETRGRQQSRRRIVFCNANRLNQRRMNLCERYNCRGPRQNNVDKERLPPVKENVPGGQVSDPEFCGLHHKAETTDEEECACPRIRSGQIPRSRTSTCPPSCLKNQMSLPDMGHGAGFLQYQKQQWSADYKAGEGVRARVSKVLWAVTRINVFPDDSKTYEVMAATENPPPLIPQTSEGIFLVIPEKKRFV